MQLQHPQLTDLLKKAYSAEKAAAFAYQGHAASVKNRVEKVAIRQIELDEWNHRKEVLQLMDQYGIQPSKYFEFRFHIVGKVISFSCYVKTNKLLPLFEKLFSWGDRKSFNNVDLDKKYPVEESGDYCKK
jgi:rubrerythrin